MLDFPLTSRRLEYTLRLAMPYLILALLTTISLAALPIPGAGLAKPYLVLMVVYYWSVNRPTLVPPVLCFGLGLLIDVLSGLPLGLNALVLVAVRWLVSDQRRFLMGQPYVTIWAIFALIALLSAGVQYLLIALVDMAWPPLMPVMTSVLISLFLFPFVSLLLIFSHRFLPTVSRG